jgi:hypothetical protein
MTYDEIEKVILLSDNELIEKCDEWVGKLCETGGRAWSLQVPANPEVDPDLLFSELIDRYKQCLGARKLHLKERDKFLKEG